MFIFDSYEICIFYLDLLDYKMYLLCLKLKRAFINKNSVLNSIWSIRS